MGERNRLGPLEVGVAGHHGFLMQAGLVQDGLLKIQDLSDDLVDFPAEVEAKVHGNLVVAAAGGVEALAGGADFFRQERLHIHVDVLVIGSEFDFPGLNISQNFLQTGGNLILVLRRNDAAVGEHRRVGDAAFNVFFVHPAVEVNRRVEVVY